MADVIKFAIDPGHGGNDPGAVKYVKEKDAVLVQGLACRDFLEAYDNVEVMMTRTKDVTMSLAQRTKKINDWDADYAVSLHLNAAEGDGSEAFHSIVGGAGKELAKNMLTELHDIGQNYHGPNGKLSEALKTRKNSAGRDYFAIIRDTKMPASILETAFVDNKKDVQLVDTKAEQQAAGYAAARGMLKTAGIKELPTYKTLDDMNLRKKASLKSGKVTVIPVGTIVAGTEVDGGWLKCKYNGQTGYVRTKGEKTYCKKV